MHPPPPSPVAFRPIKVSFLFIFISLYYGEAPEALMAHLVIAAAAEEERATPRRPRAAAVTNRGRGGGCGGRLARRRVGRRRCAPPLAPSAASTSGAPPRPRRRAGASAAGRAGAAPDAHLDARRGLEPRRLARGAEARDDAAQRAEVAAREADRAPGALNLVRELDAHVDAVAHGAGPRRQDAAVRVDLGVERGEAGGGEDRACDERLLHDAVGDV
jgi:hypothetical protein